MALYLWFFFHENQTLVTTFNFLTLYDANNLTLVGLFKQTTCALCPNSKNSFASP